MDDSVCTLQGPQHIVAGRGTALNNLEMWVINGKPRRVTGECDDPKSTLDGPVND
jgi:hypothetical protein